MRIHRGLMRGLGRGWLNDSFLGFWLGLLCGGNFGFLPLPQAVIFNGVKENLFLRHRIELVRKIVLSDEGFLGLRSKCVFDEALLYWVQ